MSEAAPGAGLPVRLEKFEGPLDLLLHLIQREEIDIRDIPIARITEQFLHYLEMMRLLDLEVSGEFLVMAATLMRIKAHTLLPVEEPLEGEEADPREELVRRLLEYRQFKEAAGTLREREEKRSLLYERGMLPTDEERGPLPLGPVTLFDLLDALDRVLARLPGAGVFEMERPVFDLEEKMALLAGLVREAGRLPFDTVLAECTSRAEVIVSFLAVLELLRTGRLAVVQDEPFGPIWLTPVSPEEWLPLPAEEREGGSS
jgi:segregation and condensation protein A